MAANEVKRKLTAIFSADVEGYSRLMGEDELATVETLTSHKEIMRKLIRQYRGRVVDSTGDNLLAEFSSVVDAVQCAVEVQQILKAKNDELPENRRMLFRIGINLGDVIEDGDRIFGDGVNIAARVESLAEGGGISLSGTAYDQLGKKLPLGYQYLGEQTVKNIEKPVRVYRILTEAEAAGKVIGELKPKTKQLRGATIGGFIVLILVVAVLAIWNFYFRPAFEPATVEKMAFPLPEKPSIAVLPFVNMSGDPAQEFICDGLTENIISALSQISKMFVIARNSTFTYKGKPVKVQQVAEELGVQYVLEGSIQKSGNKLRLTAQLIDALKGHHLWSEKYDRKMKDLFDLQDEITIKIISALQVELTEGERARLMGKGTQNLEAYIKILQAREALHTVTKEGSAKARRLSEEAISLDPKYAEAYVFLGTTYFTDVIIGASKAPKEDIKRAFELFTKAIGLDDSYSVPHSLLGMLYGRKGQYEKGIAECERAIALEPSSASACYWMGGVYRLAGRHEEAIQYFEQAIRLDPFPVAWYYRSLGLSYAATERYEEAIANYKKALHLAPNDIITHLSLTSAYSLAGRLDEARVQAAEVLRIQPKFSLKRFANRIAIKDKTERERNIDALRKAGLPDEPPLPLPDKPSIAVLPFTNMSGDPEQEYFSDGITEDIITNLSKVSGLFVISRNSSFLYKGKTVKVQDVARDLGVRYILEGSIRRGGNKVRITAQLIDGKNERHVWAESYDRELKDIFAVQDDVTRKIVSELAVALTVGEADLIARKHTENFEAYETCLRARREYKLGEKVNHLKAIELAQRTIELDPNFAGGYTLYSLLLSMGIRFGLSNSPREDLAKASELAKKAVSIDNTYGLGYAALASVYLMKGQHGEALAAARTMVSLEPGNSESYIWLSFYLNWMGRGEEAVEAVRKARELNPKYQYGRGSAYFSFMAMASFTAGLYEESISACEQNIERFGPSDILLAFLAAGYSELGKEEKAKETAQQLLKINPNFSTKSWKMARMYKDPEDTERLLNALRRAGLK